MQKQTGSINDGPRDLLSTYLERYANLRVIEKEPSLPAFERVLVLIFSVATSAITTLGIKYPSWYSPLWILVLAVFFALLAHRQKR